MSLLKPLQANLPLLKGEYMKECSTCEIDKELTEFNKRKSSKDGYEGTCKKCRHIKRLTNPKHKEIQVKATRKFEVKRKGKRWGYNLERNYGLTEDMYYKLLEAQHYTCAICKLHVDKEHHYGKLVVDHCHTTGEVRGLLCNKCNLMLGNSRDDVSILEEGIKYLKARS